MNQENITTPTIRPTLEEICSRFEKWRKKKQRPRDKIPDALWRAAVELCKDHSILRVCRALRLNYNELKYRVQGVEKIAVPSPVECSDFVELDFGESMLPSECVVEMESPSGAKMKMYFKGQQRDFDTVALSKVFWRQGL